MEFLIEVLVELICEGTVELSSNKKVPKYIRYPLITLIVLFFTMIIFGVLFLGIKVLEQNPILGIILVVLGVLLLILSIKKFKETYLKNEKKE